MGIRSFTQTLYTIRDDETGTRDGLLRRELEMACRWMPPAFDPVPARKGKGDMERPPGMRALIDLDGGSPVTEDRIRAAIEMLVDACAYYESDPPEPYRGRNREAASDMTTLIATLNMGLAEAARMARGAR